jgi:deoxyribose-phosphate aldolase
MQVVRLPRPEELAKKIHNTIVAPETTPQGSARVLRRGEEAKEYKFGAVVVQGCWVEEAKKQLGGSVPVSVGIGFPMGGETTGTKPLRQAVTFSNYAGALTVTKREVIAALPTRREVEEFRRNDVLE